MVLTTVEQAEVWGKYDTSCKKSRTGLCFSVLMRATLKILNYYFGRHILS